MIKIQEINFNEDLKKQIRFDKNCISQIVKRLPYESIIRQACYIFFRTYTRSKIRDPTLYFLSLLYSNSQINKILEYNKLKDGEHGYFVICCNDGLNRSNITITSNDERLMLTRNAINSVF
ncbi:hypothetical protein DFR86_06490 [Acidianus sulfidivorans JP7]|uniref:Uncharacterized protein n=1 Tax=Acidianus sulfidivorans JP7 TaxID=619593 RepID=A0A2U9IMJ8_9CREN|nr:hypothetical protein [Acidianus sulfidivorans]AWR97240.1 hypothetical protein DFR86_06490 [Acidianus sulfidivorans JP7]